MLNLVVQSESQGYTTHDYNIDRVFLEFNHSYVQDLALLDPLYWNKRYHVFYIYDFSSFRFHLFKILQLLESGEDVLVLVNSDMVT